MNSIADEVRDLRNEHWNVDGVIQFPVDPYVIADRLGINVEKALLPANTSGFIIREAGEQARIFLNSTDGANRQRFTLAHELGHFIQHEDDTEIGFVDKRDELASSGTDSSEIWANRFAAELLMPAAPITKWWAEGASAYTIRERLNVSSAALAYRLKNLGLLRG